MDFENNKPYMKLDQGVGKVYFLLALPIAVGHKKYIMEVLKKISQIIILTVYIRNDMRFTGKLYDDVMF